MKFTNLIKGIGATGALAMALGFSTVASAVPAFTVAPSALGGPANTFEADQINGVMSSLVTYDPSSKTTSGGGYIAFNGFGYQNAPVSNTGISNSYQLYVTYTFTSNVAGVFGALGEDALTSLNYTLWGAPGTSTAFTAANATTNTAATAVNGSAVALGTGSLLSGVTGFDSHGGAYVNSNASFAITAAGEDFFVAPTPFYDMAFNSFINTTSGIARNGNVLSVNQAIGNIDFATEVPEPISLALVGLGLLGVGVTTRRRKS